MRDFNDLLKVIKKTAVEAVQATKPMVVVFGDVVSTSPMRVRVEQKLTLSEVQLVVPESIQEKGLSTGDKVILIQSQGGQSYVVLDRVVT